MPITPYPKQIEESMEMHYKSLNQKDKRHYAWIESMKLWYWWDKYVAKILWCVVQTVARWRKEIIQKIEYPKWKIRQRWWGNKKRIEKEPKILDVFDDVLKQKTAWSPTKPEQKRTNLKPKQIAKAMKEQGVEVSIYIVNQIFDFKKLGKRKHYKGKTLKSVEWRNEQFENIKKIKKEAESKGNPVISIDTKKKNCCENLQEIDTIVVPKE